MALALGAGVSAASRAAGTSMLAWSAMPRPSGQRPSHWQPGSNPPVAFGPARLELARWRRCAPTMAARPPGREALTVGAFVSAAYLSIDRAMAQRFIEGDVLGEAGGVGRALLGGHQPHAGRPRGVRAEPPLPGVAIGDDQIRQLISNHECRDLKRG